MKLITRGLKSLSFLFTQSSRVIPQRRKLNHNELGHNELGELGIHREL